MSETQVEKKWYERTWVIVLFLIFFFPIGLILMWRFAKWSNTVKVIVTIAVAILFVLLIILLFFTTTAIIGFMLFTTNNKEESINLQESESYEEPNTEQDDDNDYFSDSQDGLNESDEEHNAQQEDNELAVLDQMKIQFDDREWFLNFEEAQQGGVFVQEYLLEGESAESWNEVVTLHFMKDMQDQPLKDFVDQMKMEAEQNGMDSEDFEVNILEENDHDLIYEFKMEDGILTQGRHELARVMKADTGIYILHYANVDVPMEDDVKEEWLDLLKQSRIEDK